MVRPSALAVLRLITSANLVGSLHHASDIPDIASLLRQPMEVRPAPDKLLLPVGQLSARVP